MGRHRVIDIRRLQGKQPGGDESAAASERELCWLGGIIEVVTAREVGDSWQRAIMRCDEPSCESGIALRRTGDACEWYCPGCSTFGAVVGWKGGKHDLTQALADDDSDRSEAIVFSRVDELASVRRCDLSAHLKLTLALSTMQSDYVVTTCAERELSELLCALEASIRKAAVAERRFIDRFVARVDAALLSCEARQSSPPTLH